MLSELRALWDHHRQVLTSMDTPPTRSEHEVEQALARLEDGAEERWRVVYRDGGVGKPLTLSGAELSACDDDEVVRIERVLVIRAGEPE